MTSATTLSREDLEVEKIFRARARALVPDQVVETDHGKPYWLEDPLGSLFPRLGERHPADAHEDIDSHRRDAHLDDEITVGEVLLSQIREWRAEVAQRGVDTSGVRWSRVEPNVKIARGSW